MSLPAKASHAQLDTITHQVVLQRVYIRNDEGRPMSPAEIERELHESNGINKNRLALPPRILVARRTMDNRPRPHNGRPPRRDRRSSLMACFSEATTATPGTTSKRRGSTDAPTVMNSHIRHAAAAANQGAYTAPALNILRQNTPSTNARNSERKHHARTTT